MILNYTPHTVNVISEAGELIASFKSLGQIRASETVTPGIPVSDPEMPLDIQTVSKKYSVDVSTLPEYRRNYDTLIVSLLVLQAMADAGMNTSDFAAPDTGPDSVVRSSDGSIIGVKRFQRIG